ncbi:stalk domain-containing protein [Paenibacillus xerothermodurans]|uniref:DUF4309 domain-containing protein n=1 Tax=Paenibacillus xerothermodurans TaxID=1977292 RepID=A0A2W1NQ68_PAEXE|nr:stalk domain-containing protein [Paenibacillus xerothermodurans]PZE19866.1 DUF4309 domain-containing protein [Paenibacillus xerothermodurans]
MKYEKKDVYFGIILGVSASSTTAVFAADTIQAYLYPVKVIFNGEEQKIPEESSVINYNNQAYVPLRFVSEKIGATVGYQEGATVEETKITLDFTKQGATEVNNLIVDKELISIASQGKLQGIDIPLGTSKEELINKLGEPDSIKKANSEEYKYGRTTFYIYRDTVNVIDAELDLSPAEVKSILGKPHIDGMSDAGVTQYLVGYEADPNYLCFSYTSEESKSGVLRLKNPKGSSSQ